MPAKIYDKQLVRTDSRDQKIDKFLSASLSDSTTPMNQSNISVTDPVFDIFDESFATKNAERESLKETRKEPLFSKPANTTPKQKETYCQGRAASNPIDPGKLI